MNVNSNSKRVIVVTWKDSNETEIFSNLKIFCLSYPKYNYNTLNNYLSKAKVPFDISEVCVERKSIINHPKSLQTIPKLRQIAAIVNKASIKENNDEKDLLFWLDQPVQKRAQAVTFMVKQMLKNGERMDKNAVKKIRPKL